MAAENYHDFPESQRIEVSWPKRQMPPCDDIFRALTVSRRRLSVVQEMCGSAACQVRLESDSTAQRTEDADHVRVFACQLECAQDCGLVGSSEPSSPDTVWPEMPEEALTAPDVIDVLAHRNDGRIRTGVAVTMAGVLLAGALSAGAVVARYISLDNDVPSFVPSEDQRYLNYDEFGD